MAAVAVAIVTCGCCFFFLDFLEVVEAAGAGAACCVAGMVGGLAAMPDTTDAGSAVGASATFGGSIPGAGMLLAVTAPTSMGGRDPPRMSSVLIVGVDIFK